MAASDESDFTEMIVLSKGRVLQYVVPSFPVYKPVLREVKLQWKENDVIHVFDGFARECKEMDQHDVPAMARIYNSFGNAFVIEVLNACYSVTYRIMHAKVFSS